MVRRKGEQAGYTFYGSYCKAHTAERVARWRSDPANRAHWNDGRHRLNTMRKFGLSEEQYDALYKNPVCAGCMATAGPQRKHVVQRLALDHDHATGRVRGLLCHDCNRTIATAHDDPAILRRLADYLEQPFL